MNLRYFFIALILSLPFWWGVNFFEKKLEEFFFWQEINQNPQIFTAQLDLEKKLEELIPMRNLAVNNLEINGRSAIAVLIKPDGTFKILFEKEKNRKLPIASLTKLMTALVVLENYDLEKEIEISKTAILQEEEFGNLKIGERFLVGDLLYFLLMESSNSSAIALAEIIGEKEFVDLMNITAANLGLEKTFFINPTGLDPENLSDPTNYSTTEDLVKLTRYLRKNQPLVWEIAGLSEFDLYLPDGVLRHKVKNTNKLLEEFPQIGGKTGWTLRAQGCLIVVIRAEKNRGELINVVLGAGDRFEEMKKIVNWLNGAYRW